MADADRAMDRVRDEMAKSSGKPGVIVLGNYLTGRLRKEPGIAEQLLNEKKTLAGAFSEIRGYAEKNRNGLKFAVVDDATAYGILCEYYGIPKDGEAPAEEQEPEKPAKPAQTPADELDIDALLNI